MNVNIADVICEQVRFGTVEWSLLSTFVMMIGEMEYDSLFFADFGVDRDTEEFVNSTVNYKVKPRFLAKYLTIMYITVFYDFFLF